MSAKLFGFERPYDIRGDITKQNAPFSRSMFGRPRWSGKAPVYLELLLTAAYDGGTFCKTLSTFS